MPDAPDMDLVREFARGHSETAFAELVRRHIALVYSVARRFTGNPGDAEDVTQAVFILLARKAAGLRARVVLTGWLYETTRFTAARLLHANARRRAREQEAFMQSTLLNETAVSRRSETETDDFWEKLSPHLEAAMSKLAERDRTLLALRFYENKTGPEAAALLGIREAAAHKRAARALEKLRKFFSKRGIDSTAATIAETISAHSVQAAPAALAKTVTAVALAKGATASASTSTLIKGALKIMAWTKMKTVVAAGTVLILTAGTTTVAVKHYWHSSQGKLPPTPANVASFQHESTKRVNDAKWTTLACLLFADSHQNQLPKNFAELNASSVGKNNAKYQQLSDTDWEVVASGDKDSFTNPDKTIYFFEKNPRQSPDGTFVRVYATVNGRVFLITSPDKDFTAVEKQQGFLIGQVKN